MEREGERGEGEGRGGERENETRTGTSSRNRDGLAPPRSQKTRRRGSRGNGTEILVNREPECNSSRLDFVAASTAIRETSSAIKSNFISILPDPESSCL